MKSTYKNYIRSKELIRNALITLLKTKNSISEITVTEIVKTAGINRGTFYNHYNNIIEVFDEIKNEILNNLTDETTINPKKRNIYTFIETVTRHFKKSEDVYRQILPYIPRDVIEDMKLKFISQVKSFGLRVDKLDIYFVVNGLAGLYIDYLENKLYITLEELGKKSIEIVDMFIK